MTEQERLVDYWKTHREVRFEELGGNPGRIICVRLLAGSDLLQGIGEVAKKYFLRAGAIQVAITNSLPPMEHSGEGLREKFPPETGPSGGVPPGEVPSFRP